MAFKYTIVISNSLFWSITQNIFNTSYSVNSISFGTRRFYMNIFINALWLVVRFFLAINNNFRTIFRLRGSDRCFFLNSPVVGVYLGTMSQHVSIDVLGNTKLSLHLRRSVWIWIKAINFSSTERNVPDFNIDDTEIARWSEWSNIYVWLKS